MMYIIVALVTALTTPRPLDNSINSGLTNPKTVIIENNMQDQIINTDTDSPKLEIAEIVHVGTKDDCSILIKIGERNHKAHWDSGAGKCVISYDKYKTISEKLKLSSLQVKS